MSIISIVAIFYFYDVQVSPENSNSFWQEPAQFLDSILPNLLDGLIYYSVVENPFVIISTLIFGIIYTLIRRFCYVKNSESCEELRHLVITEKTNDATKNTS